MIEDIENTYLKLFQFFVRTADADVGKYLHMFTLLPAHDIVDVLKKHEVSFCLISSRSCV